MKDKAGKLYVVATPIGNLEDLTRRAERVLAEVDLVVAEDTRRTRQLLAAIDVKKPLLSYYEPKEEAALPAVLARLEAGEDLALVTDGGTPAISDPGYRLVRAALEAGFTVIPIPGPSALTAALSAAGLPTHRVTFVGFVAAKSGARRRELAELADRTDTLVFYESPRRVAEFLADARSELGEREAVIFREITKLHEERLRGKLSELEAALRGVEVKGEVTILIAGATAGRELSEEEVAALIEAALAAGDRKPSEIAADVARQSGWRRADLYKLVLRIKDRT